MNIDLEMLNAQVDALRIAYLGLLFSLYPNDPDRRWLARYYFWQTERENLATLSYRVQTSSHETDKIDRRRFQLQVLMDVAYIQGGLEGFDIQRRIDPYSFDLAMRVYSQTDGSEEEMIRELDRIRP